jgi:diguanylate cyclase (GGDEF)-like protein/PAS domain S-box-containing protein
VGGSLRPPQAPSDPADKKEDAEPFSALSSGSMSSSFSSRFSLAAWVNTSLLATLLCAIAVAGFLVERSARRHVEEQAAESLNRAAWSMRDAIDRGFALRADWLRMLAGMPQLWDPARPADVAAALKQAKGRLPHLAWLGLADPQGRIVAASDDYLRDRSVAGERWLQAALQAPHIGEVRSHPALEKLLRPQPAPWRFVDVAVPVRDADGKTVAVLAGHFSWEWVRQMHRQQLDPVSSQAHGVQLWLLDRDGTVLLGPPGEEGKRLPLPPGTSQDKTVRPDLRRTPLGQGDVLLASAPVLGANGYPAQGWTVVARQPEAIALQSFRTLRNELLVVGVATAGLFLLASAALARALSRPLQELKLQVERRTAGELSPITRRPEYREADALAHAFADLTAREAALAEELRTANANLEERVRERTEALRTANENLTSVLHAKNETEQSLLAGESKLRSILANASDGFIGMDEQGLVTEWNTAAEELFGWTRQEVVGRALADLIIPQAHRAAHNAGLKRFVKTGEGPVVGNRLELTALHRDGHEIPVQLSVGAVRIGDEYVINGFLHDITERKRFEQSLKNAHDFLRSITDELPALIAYVDKDYIYRFNNAAFERWFRKPLAEITGRHLRDLVGAAAFEQQKKAMEEATTRGAPITAEAAGDLYGSEIVVRITYTPQFDHEGQLLGFCVLAQDVTDSKRQEAQLVRAATKRDPLTGLLNRTGFDDRLTEAFKTSRQNGKPLGVAYLDFDLFKSVNDTHGHDAGDALLKAFASRALAVLRHDDALARLEGDEFALILQNVDETAAAEVVRKLHIALSHPLMFEGKLIPLSVSIGFAVHEVGEMRQHFLRRADLALAQAKAERSQERVGRVRESV